MTASLDKLRTLGWLEWQTILSSLLRLPACALALRIKGYRRVRDEYQSERRLASLLSHEEQRMLAQRIARAVGIAACYGPYRANCLKRSLVLTRLLQKRGIEHELKLGAAVQDGDFSAHAWVEHLGVPLNDDPALKDRFNEFRGNTRQGQ
ncbi:MAG TPA: lasso peptide biosynthesis B2 protein [Xanthomonadales bacterium]|nr:lasso peptide biosynthesis B2 protein [Xanthomonadales bacterium]